MMKNREQAERHSAASVGVVAFLSNGDPPKRSTRPPFLLELVSQQIVYLHKSFLTNYSSRVKMVKSEY